MSRRYQYSDPNTRLLADYWNSILQVLPKRRRVDKTGESAQHVVLPVPNVSSEGV